MTYEPPEPPHFCLNHARFAIIVLAALPVMYFGIPVVVEIVQVVGHAAMYLMGFQR